MMLVQADRAIIQGDPSRAFISDHEIPADELGEVMHIRNIMLTSLKENENKLKQRLDELEQFRKVTIQREIRMRELKDRVEELEKEIEKLRGM
jgi:polyhydroxyalkanoate synthesis regulator phasin